MTNLEKNYYNLKELSPIVNLKYRALKERIKKISSKYENKKDLLYKKGNKWFIHCSIVKDFKRQRKPIDYKWFVTITSRNQFEMEYWKYIINHHLNKLLKKIDATTRIKYVIEPHISGKLHLHYMTNFRNKRTLRTIMKQDYLTDLTNDMNILIENVYYVKGLHEYFRKQNRPVLLK